MRTLRQKTLKAMTDGREKRKRDLLNERKLNNLEQRRLANEIIQKIPDRAFNAANEKNRYAVIMTDDDGPGIVLKQGSIKRYWWRKPGKVDPQFLVGASRIVFNACAKAGLDPKVYTSKTLRMSRSATLVMIIPVKT